MHSEDASVVTRNGIPKAVFSGKEHKSRALWYSINEDSKEFEATSDKYENDRWNYKRKVTWDFTQVPHVECG